ncbi:hypothetical protein [Ferruginibacter sp. SUN106]|uniref:hypothetical protein n=1 Tax=Ferruginibacter sp. SUN106 TaxID=2978348 RepID=UPI003D36236B
MKFLTKTDQSQIFIDNLVYRSGNTRANQNLRNLLLKEQCGFCAYTEEYLIESTLCPEVEHFDPSKKNNADNYYNYYVVSRFANQRKMKVDRTKKYNGASFFVNLFFQNITKLYEKIEYKEGVYVEKDGEDKEAKEFIEYMGFNEDVILKKRNNAIRRLKNTIGNFSQEEKIEYLKLEDKDILSFPTAIEYEFKIDLSEILNS